MRPLNSCVGNRQRCLPAGKFSDKVLTKMYFDEWVRFPQTDIKCDVASSENSWIKVTEAGKRKTHSGCINQGESEHGDGER